MTLAGRLAAFAGPLRFDDLPSDVVASVRLRALDVLGIALAASTHEIAPAVLGVHEAWAGDGPCTVIGSSRGATAPLAAMLNGALAHGLDFDDTHAASITHASAVVLPAVLAAGEGIGADGRTVVTAAAVGLEAIARIGMAAAGAFHERGFHATSVCGAPAAALAVGRVMGLGAPDLTNALGVAGSFASGLQEFLADGSWVKRVHAGWAAHAGVVAAGLAQHGFPGPATVLEGRFGLYRAFLGAERAAALDTAPFDTLGREWETRRIGFKPYPCCHYLHAYLDCALALRANIVDSHEPSRLNTVDGHEPSRLNTVDGHEPSRLNTVDGHEPSRSIDQIVAVECRVPAGEVPVVCEPRAAKLRPRTAYEAQFSLPYSMAAAFLDGRVGLDTYDAKRLDDGALLELAGRVTHVVDPDSRFPDGFPGWVRVRLADGRVLEAREPEGRGGPRRPLPDAAIVEKFRANAARALPEAAIATLEETVLRLDRLDDVRPLMRSLRT
ncbi:MAG: MmgE/PrpD family protein [Candidatus Rokubacteria bacterium]|nr:MmgE/PrpD family protein [Candidatus Rokubacteria bacterium]